MGAAKTYIALKSDTRNACPAIHTPLQALARHSAMVASLMLETRFLWGMPMDHSLQDFSLDSLAGLTFLESLNLVFCHVTGSCAHLAPLTRLGRLCMSWCSLSHVPREIAGLTGLSFLDLSDNVRLGGGCQWQHLAPLRQQLRHLSLRQCGLAEVLEALSLLTGLSLLDLSYDFNVAGGWQHLLPLQQLQVLNLDGCQQLTAVPLAVSSMTALHELHLSEAPLEGGWQHLLPLGHLRALSLRSCCLTDVPWEVSVLTCLTRLNISENYDIEVGWQHLRPLRQLLDLDISGCNLTQVPKALSCLVHLSVLNLGSNSITSGWQRLLPLRQLRELALNGCDLAKVPKAVSELTALTALNLAANRELKGGSWQRLLPLQQLQHLCLTHCGLREVPRELRALKAPVEIEASPYIPF